MSDDVRRRRVRVMSEYSVTARWVFPVSGPPLERGVLIVRPDDGRIIGVEPRGSRIADHDFGNAAIVPGFVNAHTHLDLTGARGLTPPTPDFIEWLRRVINFRKSRTPDQVDADIVAGIEQCCRFGTTLVGDIASNGRSASALVHWPIRAIVFREILGPSLDRARESLTDAERWLRNFIPNGDVSAAFSPHAPYTVPFEVIRESFQMHARIAIHLAEAPCERELLTQRRGPLADFLQELESWAPDELSTSFEEIVALAGNGTPVVFAHCNYLSPDTPIPTNASIAYCPRTHAAFDHPPHSFREFLSRGGRVALGTDSLASNPDLDLLGEARFIASRYSDFDRASLLRMATLSGAEALACDNDTGSLEPGKSADFAVVALPNRDEADPHELLFNSVLPVRSTWFRGDPGQDWAG